MALTNIVGYVTEEFNRAFGTRLAYQGRIDRVPLCVDTETLVPTGRNAARARLGVRTGDFVALYLGYISLLKCDLVPVIRVWGSLVGENPGRNLLLVIAGTADPTYRDRLQSYVHSLKLDRHVRFVYDPNDAAKERLLPAADAFVSPADSAQESFGLAPVEAMSCGVPQVVSDWDGYRDTVVNGDTGFLVPTRWTDCADQHDTGSVLGWQFDHACLGQSVSVDLRALKGSMHALIVNEGLRHQMSENSRRRAEAHYSMPVVVRQYEALWSELSAIAHRLPSHLISQNSNYGQPLYFRFFGHYSSIQLDHSTPLKLTASGRRVVRGDEPLPLDSQLPKAGLFDPALLQVALLKLENLEDGNHRTSNQRTLGGIVRSIAGDQGRGDGYLLRHVMWLMKAGLIDVCDATRAPAPDELPSQFRLAR
ncbi:MAG: glycosyltransferase family 4 protein [Terriglobia bacterium]